jgi:hypothetical protein
MPFSSAAMALPESMRGVAALLQAGVDSSPAVCLPVALSPGAAACPLLRLMLLAAASA